MGATGEPSGYYPMDSNELARRHFLRAYDAVHLASALTVHSVLASLEGYALVFVSADQRLLQCAQQEGLSVENPLNYS
ncbi:MAG: hypothetical protein KatS3mg016_1418 [Fimbriimonadales bacterium]|nr:MAG: hypothetical protein KatS3mg016_1418 [Fimbriimonadales bacterium]